MRTTLEIDDSILAAAKEIAAVQKTSAGAVISDLARKGLTATARSFDRQMARVFGPLIVQI